MNADLNGMMEFHKKKSMDNIIVTDKGKTLNDRETRALRNLKITSIQEIKTNLLIVYGNDYNKYTDNSSRDFLFNLWRNRSIGPSSLE